MGRLVEETVLWLKSIEKVKAPLEEFPEIVQSVLQSFRKFAASTKTLEELKLEKEKKVAAANKAVETRYQEMVQKVQGSDQDRVKQVLETNKKVLADWLSEKVESLQGEILQHQDFHAHNRDRFDKDISELIHAAFREYKENKNHHMNVELDIADASSLRASLDMELEVAMCGDDLDDGPVDESVPTATSAFMQSQEVIGKTLDQNNIPDSLKDKLVENVQGLFKTAFEHKPAVETTKVPSLPPPASNPGGLPENETQEIGKVAGEPNTELEDKRQELGPAEKRLLAVTKEMERKDTTQLEHEASWEKDKVIGEDGKVYYVTSKGVLETLEERKARLAHNSWMRFSRSFNGILPAHGLFNMFFVL